MDKRVARRANARASAVVGVGVLAFAAALVAASKDAIGLSHAAAACTALCTVWLARDGWHRGRQGRAAKGTADERG
ncbi:hypothetical protein [Streptomyces anulatus]|uniref:hypothetical protein n=1 Tax=Streptomyces anulatus TaxID=1892 RepID=UPI001C2625F3|nr:hypothetical protein [Streptomyces anulatus]